MQTYPPRQTHLFLEQNPGNLPISPIPQMIDLIYPPIHDPPIHLSSRLLTQPPLTPTCSSSSLHSHSLSSLQAGCVPEGNKKNFLGTQPLTLPTSIQGWGAGVALLLLGPLLPQTPVLLTHCEV